ncbi:MAG: anti-sigma factor [Gemmatimonadaceae bacterium]
MPRIAGILAAVLCTACGAADGGASGGTSPPPGATLTASFPSLPALDPAREGRYTLWVVPRSGAAVSVASFAGGNGTSISGPLPAGSFERVEVTVEPPGDSDPLPSPQRLLTGALSDGAGTLSVVSALTVGSAELREKPGQFTMFSPSDNGLYGYPSHEESGIWLFNMAPRDTEQRDMWVRLTPLREGWIYEGWMVRDVDAPQAIWLSYGKFQPDPTGAVNQRDDTGWGPFSGVPDYRLGEEEFPGDDWIDNILGLPFPAGLSLPLDLREKTMAGVSRWTHVITIEPFWNRGEPMTTERPFVLRPYRDAFGDGAPGTPRTITFHASQLPQGTARVR